jgi:8-oxo-dGTP pyrophosphatase MutT (NUDIX family)
LTTDLITRRKVAENSRWSIFFDEIRDSLGRHVPDYMVASPKRLGPDLCGGVAVIAERQGQVGLLNLYRHAIARPGLEVVKGFLEDGEGPIDAARRELAEEAGLACAPDDLIELGPTAPEAATIGAFSLGFLARNCQILDEAPLSDEAQPSQLGWYDLDCAADLALGRKPEGQSDFQTGPGILDAVSLICVLRAHHILRDRRI